MASNTRSTGGSSYLQTTASSAASNTAHSTVPTFDQEAWRRFVGEVASADDFERSVKSKWSHFARKCEQSGIAGTEDPKSSAIWTAVQSFPDLKAEQESLTTLDVEVVALQDQVRQSAKSVRSPIECGF